jgi:hypothetical protein
MISLGQKENLAEGTAREEIITILLNKGII